MEKLDVTFDTDNLQNTERFFRITWTRAYTFRCISNGKCRIVPMRTKRSGTASLDGTNGADYYLMYENRLPEYYIEKEEAENLGWISKKGNLDAVAPGKMIYGEHQNRSGKLPAALGREWYEADINYYGGYRGHDRILFSNDGLIFVTYDHYQTFYEITR